MQDRFKFRYNNNNKIYDVFAIDLFHSTGQIVSLDRKETLMCKINLDNLIQCTGLKDKNGKLIYEGDIVRFYFDNDEIIAVIEWDDDECRFYLNTTDFFKDKYVTDYEIVNQEEYEVIGNIYENPELLKDGE